MVNEKPLVKRVVLWAIAFVALPTAIIIACQACSTKASDETEKEMVRAISAARNKAIAQGDLRQARWLGVPVLDTLRLEFSIISTTKAQKNRLSDKDLMEIGNMINLEEYNRTLRRVLTQDQYRRLCNLRVKYQYAQYFGPQAD